MSIIRRKTATAVRVRVIQVIQLRIITIMNTTYFTKGIVAKMFAAIALFSLIAGMVPMQAFATSDVSTNTKTTHKLRFVTQMPMSLVTVSRR